MHRRLFNFVDLDVVGIKLSLGLSEVLLDLALELFRTAFDVFAGIVGGIPKVTTDLALHLFGGPFDLVLETPIV